MATNLLPETNSAGSSLDDMDAINSEIVQISTDSQNAQTTNRTATNCNQNTNKTNSNKIESISNRINEEDAKIGLTASNANNNQKCDSQLNEKATKTTEELLENNKMNRNTSKLNTIDSNRRAGGYLIAVHRKLSRQDTYFMSYHKTRPSLFGVPLLIPCYDDGTNKDLYCAVWIQVARLLSPLPSTPPDQSNHATDW